MLNAIEEHWGVPLPADYAAFLLTYNGGRPNRFLYSYQTVNGYGEAGPTDIYTEIRFFSSRHRTPDGRSYFLASLAELYDDPPEEDDARFDDMMPIAWLRDTDNGEEMLMGLLMDPDEEYERYIVTTGPASGGPSLFDEVHNSCDFIGLLTGLCALPSR
jgi:hypothetical protein